jgi:hypothetical protein
MDVTLDDTTIDARRLGAKGGPDAAFRTPRQPLQGGAGRLRAVAVAADPGPRP